MDPPPPATPPTEPAENTQPSTEPQEIDAPLVFQCASCSTIVADSFAWFESQQLLKTITLYAQPSNVTVSTELAFSSAGADLGSAFKPIRCIRCGTVVGKVYQVTPRWMDHLIDKFTFDLGTLTIYQLGRYINPSTLSPSLTAIDDLPTLPSARETRRSMEKMQKLICLFSERLVMLEQEMSRARVSLPHQSYTADEGFALSASDVTTRLGIIGGSSTTYAAGLSTYPGQDDVVSSATPESSSPAKAAEIPPLSAAATSAPLPPLSPTTTITTFGNSLTSSSPRPTNLSTSDIAAGTNSQQGGPNPKQNESPRSLRPGARSIQDNVSVEVEPWSLTREKRRKEGNIAGEGRITRGNADKGDETSTQPRKRTRQPAGR